MRSFRLRLRRRLARRGVPHSRYQAAGAAFVPRDGKFRYVVRRRGCDVLDAVSSNLGLVQDSAEIAGVQPFLVDAPPGGATLMGIAATSLVDFAAGVRALAGDLPICVRVHKGGRSRSGLAYHLLEQDLTGLTSLVVWMNFDDPLTGQRFTSGFGCTVEGWGEGAEGGLVAPNLNGRAASISARSRGSAETAVAHGRPVITHAPLQDPTPFDVTFPVDAVYLWVDGDDPAWQRRRAARLDGMHRPPPTDALSEVRFEQGDELRFSLRSLERYAPWIRRIFLVTDRQRPWWLVERPGELDVVDHRDILPASCLPTYNSHAITAAIHRIDGLSDRFLLFNDDVLLGRPIDKDAFFFANGANKFFPSRSALPGDPTDVASSPLFAARQHTREVIQEMTGMSPSFGFRHTPVAFNKALLTELAETVPEWGATMGSPFRSASDIVPSWLHHYLGFDRRWSFPSSISYSYIDIGSGAASQRFLERVAARHPPSVFCVNDVTYSSVGGQSRHSALVGMLERLQPRSSRYERA